MSLDPGVIFLSLITGGIGFVLFVYGKKQERWPHMAAGVAMMVCPYFVDGVVLQIAIAIAICVALWIAVRGGW